MATEDPFFVVKDEVQKTIATSEAFFRRWCELSTDQSGFCREEHDWTTNELRNCLRSIDWDLEDLEETISIVEKNPRKFRIDAAELNGRRLFIQQTKSSIKAVRDRMTGSNTKIKTKEIHSALPISQSSTSAPDKALNKYSRLQNEPDVCEETAINNHHNHQMAGIHQNGISAGTVGQQSVNDSSPQPVSEHDEQSIMLGDIHELDSSDTRVRGALKRACRVLHVQRDWKQWTAICILLLIVAIVILMFFVL